MSELTKQGEIIAIDEIQTFPSGFQKRQFVIKTTDDGDYPQDIPFDLIKDKCDYTDKFSVGDVVDVHFNIRGNEYKGKYYVNLTCWRIDGVAVQVKTQKAAPAREVAQAVAPAASVQPSEDMDDIPF